MNDKEKIKYHDINQRIESANGEIQTLIKMFEKTDLSAPTAKLMLDESIQELKNALFDYIDFYGEHIKLIRR